MDKAIILGAGTYGQVYQEYLKELNQYDFVGFLDDDQSKRGQSYNGMEVIGSFEDLQALKNEIQTVFAPIGNNEVRVQLLKECKRLGYNTPCFVHPQTTIHSSVEVGEAVYVLPSTNIMPFAVLSNYVMLSMGVNIAHHTCLAEGCFVSQGSNIGASIDIEERTFIGIASTVMTGVERVGKNTTVGAGSVVIKDLPEEAIAAGVPAKILRYKNKPR